ncbi:MAG: ABC transporter permease [Clostridiales bacterium]|nr:ABC transporter permease [Clostridiales bacterium]
MELFLKSVFSADFLFVVIRTCTPILFAAMAAMISTKCGVVNITIDGTMLMSALMGTLVSAYTQNLFLGFLAGFLTGTAMGGFLAFFHVKMKTPSNLTGVAMNLFANGFSVFLCALLAGDKGSTSKLSSLTFPTINIPIIKDIPVLGTIVSGHNLLTYVCFLMVILLYIFIYRTPFGLKMRAVGENETAARSVGENTDRIKIISLLLAGAVSSLGGMFLSMGYVSWFTRGMTGGRGFIGVAANAIGHGNPVFVMLASLLFAVAQALSNSIQILQLPSELVMAIPYAITLAIMVVNSARENIGESSRKRKLISSIHKAG